jgi:glucosamine-6-phosphate deaminase
MTFVIEREPDRAALGRHATRDVAAELRRLLDEQEHVRMMFAAAPSQSETLHGLATEPGIDWSRVTAFHMDEYLGLPSGAEQRFGNWLQREFFEAAPLGEVHLIDTSDAVEGTRSYAALLSAAPLDVVCLGIGANGHIAFNDPSTADLDDPESVKVVALEEASRRQQVDDGCFGALADVPTHAITVTVPPILAARRLFCMVPGSLKANAVKATVMADVSPRTPSTALRQHPACTLYLDADSSALLRAS